MHRKSFYVLAAIVAVVAFFAGAYLDAAGTFDFSAWAGTPHPHPGDAASGVVTKHTALSVVLKYPDGSTQRFAVSSQTPVTEYPLQLAASVSDLALGERVMVTPGANGSASIVAITPNMQTVASSTHE